jgi:hypothetical protein
MEEINMRGEIMLGCWILVGRDRGRVVGVIVVEIEKYIYLFFWGL